MFKELCQKEDLVITKINNNKIYFKLGNVRYLIYEGIDDDQELYTSLYLVDNIKRKVIEPIGFCYGHVNPISLIEFKNQKEYRKGMTYSHIVSTDKLKTKLLDLVY